MENVKDSYLISETARLVGVENHVLRYWEEELKLPIRRNEMGHRYYTAEDVEQFREIKKLKEQGLQLKAIRTVLTDHSPAGLSADRKLFTEAEQEEGEDNDYPDVREKSLRLQMLLHNLVSQAVRENNGELIGEIRETILKEMDYQFRIREEEELRRDREQLAREEEHCRKLDELLRQYGSRPADKNADKKELRQRRKLERSERKKLERSERKAAKRVKPADEKTSTEEMLPKEDLKKEEAPLIRSFLWAEDKTEKRKKHSSS